MTTTELESRVVALEAQVAKLNQALEQTRIAARIRHGLEQVDRGQVRPVLEALDALSKKHNIPA